MAATSNALDDQTKEQIVGLRKKGFSRVDIAEIMGVSNATVSRVLAQIGDEDVPLRAMKYVPPSILDDWDRTCARFRRKQVKEV